ncbi:arginase [Candidatus Saccharibacteria bacterium]|nr:arginase [Candidatus Saccharibacteria bacterium]
MKKWPTSAATLIGIPLDLGAKNLGVDIGPDAFRHQGIIDKLSSAGLEVKDYGDIKSRDRSELEPGDDRLRYLEEIVRVSEETAKLTNEIIGRQEHVIAIGGDHSINLGVVAGASAALNGDLGLIYLDAHGDMNTADTTQTGNIHGMHLASLLGFGDERLINVHHEGAKIAKEHLLHIGGSDLDQPEIDLMEREKLPHFKLVDLLCDGMRPLLDMIDALANKVSHTWVSLDLDVIDRVYAPGAGMPNPGGLSYREIAAIAEYIGMKCNVVGIDVVEYNPLQDENKKTAELGIELIAKFFGSNYSWYTGYMAANKL